jgi:hypothetical protein
MQLIDDIEMNRCVLRACSLAMLFVLTGCMDKDVAFESSDGEWADNEVLMKGRDFEVILSSFEAYRLKCNRPEVSLIRTTEPGWFTDTGSPKWNVPYRLPSPDIAGGYRQPDCMQGGYSQEESVEIRRKAAEAFSYWSAAQ